MLCRASLAASFAVFSSAVAFAQAPAVPPYFHDPMYYPPAAPMQAPPPSSQGFPDRIYSAQPPANSGFKDRVYGVQPPPNQGYPDPIYGVQPPASQGYPDRIYGVQPAAMQAPTMPADGGLFPPAPPVEAPPRKLWSGSVESGLTGATGNTEILNYRFFATADRAAEANLFHTDLIYLLGKEDGKSTQNTMIANLRNEILFAGSPWSFFGSAFFDYDELRDYKTILGLYAGVGYLVADTETQFFKLRFGAGTIFKTSGSANPGHLWEPSLDFGYDYKYRFGERSAFISTLDYYPSLDKGFGEFLLRLKAAYECTLDPKSGLFFRIGIFERYDSNPGPGYEKSDLNYYTALGFNF